MLLGMALMITVGISLLSAVEGNLIWLAVILAGFVRDGFMALFMTMIIETDGVGSRYAGTATGFVMVFSGLGNLVAPAVGNRMAEIAPGAPFIFWAALSVVGGITLSRTREPQSSANGSLLTPSLAND